MKKKNILIVMMHLKMGGAEKSLVNFLNEVDNKKYNVDLLLFKKQGELINDVPKWINILEIPNDLQTLYSNKIINPKSFLLLFIKFFSTLLCKFISRIFYFQYGVIRWRYFYSLLCKRIEKKYDVAISYTNGECIGFLCDKVDASRRIGWIHTEYNSYRKSLKQDKYYFNKLDNIVTISDICAESIIKCHPELKDKVVCIPNITSGNLIKNKAESFIPFEKEAQCVYIVSVGRLEKVKGFDLALEAAIQLKKRINFKWYIVGDGSEFSSLSKFINKNCLDNNVFLVGTKTNPYPYIYNSDIVVQSSRFEGKSIVLDEAKILGIPIVATNYKTINDQLNSNEGIVVKMNSKAIADGIEMLATNDAKYLPIKEYLSTHSYDNSDEILKYYNCIDGDKR